MKKFFQFNLAGILMFNNLILLFLPIAMIYYLKFYENELIHQTHSELIVQAAFISSFYKAELEKYPKAKIDGNKIKYINKQKEFFQPITSDLDLYKDSIFPARPDGRISKQKADKLSLEIGKTLLPILLEAQRTTLSGMKILDHKGIVIAGKNELKLSFAHLPEISQALNGKYTSILRYRENNNAQFSLSSISRTGKINVVVAVPIIFQDKVIAVVYLSRTAKNLQKALYERRGRILSISIILLFLGLFSAILTAFSITKPINSLVNSIDQFSEQNQTPILNKSFFISKEILVLTNTFQNMAEQIQSRSSYIRNFALHISHEFKTPLTTIQGTIELFNDHYNSMNKEERQHFLQIINQDVKRLKNLVNRLIELARADILQPVSGSFADLDQIINKLIIQYKESGLKIDKYLNPINFRVKIAPELIETILINLIDNAKANEATKIYISQETNQNNSNFLILKFSDNGKGILPENLDKIFLPFYTTKKNSGGTGLGLSIVQSLLKAHNGSIKLIQTPNQGVTFELILPV